MQVIPLANIMVLFFTNTEILLNLFQIFFFIFHGRIMDYFIQSIEPLGCVLSLRHIFSI